MREGRATSFAAYGKAVPILDDDLKPLDMNSFDCRPPLTSGGLTTWQVGQCYSQVDLTYFQHCLNQIFAKHPGPTSED